MSSLLAAIGAAIAGISCPGRLRRFWTGTDAFFRRGRSLTQPNASDVKAPLLVAVMNSKSV